MSKQTFQDLAELVLKREPESEPVLSRCRAFFTRYATLEDAILGEIPLQFPSHIMGAALPPDPLEAGTLVAARELDRLGQPTLGLDGMQVFLDAEQFKVYRFEAPHATSLAGFFLFDPELGPVFAVNRSLDRGESDRTLARLYGHFLMDNDPYEVQLLWSGESDPGSSALRASAFASALLIPEQALKDYLEALELEPGRLTPEGLQQLSVYFGVSASLVALRFVAAGWCSAKQMEQLVSSVDAAAVGWERHGDSPFGDRYVLLALEAHAREAIDLKTLAEYLETTQEEAALWNERFRLSPETSEFEDLPEDQDAE